MIVISRRPDEMGVRVTSLQRSTDNKKLRPHDKIRIKKYGVEASETTCLEVQLQQYRVEEKPNGPIYIVF